MSSREPDPQRHAELTRSPLSERTALAEPRASLELAAHAWLLEYEGHTRAAYARDLAAWAGWCAEHGIEPAQAPRAAAAGWREALTRLDLAPATIARRLASLSSFYRYLLDEELAATNPFARVRRPVVPDDSPTLGLDRTELAAFLATAAASGPRDHALACLLALNGLRVSEACAADAADLTTERGHRTLRIRRKGGRDATRALAPRTAEAIDAHLEGRPPGPLLLANDARARLDRHDATRIVRRVAAGAGIPGRISPHSLRHTFVTLALDAGASLRDVQDAAGHADPRTTRRYDRARGALDRDPTYLVASHVA